jgi:hypothetical protein
MSVDPPSKTSNRAQIASAGPTIRQDPHRPDLRSGGADPATRQQEASDLAGVTSVQHDVQYKNNSRARPGRSPDRGGKHCKQEADDATQPDPTITGPQQR